MERKRWDGKGRRKERIEKIKEIKESKGNHSIQNQLTGRLQQRFLRKKNNQVKTNKALEKPEMSPLKSNNSDAVIM